MQSGWLQQFWQRQTGRGPIDAEEAKGVSRRDFLQGSVAAVEQFLDGIWPGGESGIQGNFCAEVAGEVRPIFAEDPSGGRKGSEFMIGGSDGELSGDYLHTLVVGSARQLDLSLLYFQAGSVCSRGQRELCAKNASFGLWGTDEQGPEKALAGNSAF